MNPEFNNQLFRFFQQFAWLRAESSQQAVRLKRKLTRADAAKRILELQTRWAQALREYHQFLERHELA